MKIRVSFLAIVATLFLMISTITVKAQQSRELMLAGHKMDPPVGTGASGMVTVTLKNDTLSVTGDFSDLMSNYFGAYIMAEIRGKAGNVLYRLKADLDEEKTSGTFKESKNSFKLSPQELTMLREGKLFITVSSFDHKRGEIRSKIPPIKQ